MGLDVATRRLVTKELKGRYDRGSKAQRTAVLDELCGLTGLASRPCAEGAAVRAGSGAGAAAA